MCHKQFQRQKRELPAHALLCGGALPSLFQRQKRELPAQALLCGGALPSPRGGEGAEHIIPSRGAAGSGDIAGREPDSDSEFRHYARAREAEGLPAEGIPLVEGMLAEDEPTSKKRRRGPSAFAEEFAAWVLAQPT